MRGIKLLTVGDINQSIMLWAGARKTVFTDFQNEFLASNKFLVKNYRASKEIQDVLDIVLEHFRIVRRKLLC
jgi:superfamily I DNA/RNA helicase